MPAENATRHGVVNRTRALSDRDEASHINAA
jgi:hypothetical protein